MKSPYITWCKILDFWILKLFFKTVSTYVCVIIFVLCLSPDQNDKKLRQQNPWNWGLPKVFEGYKREKKWTLPDVQRIYWP